MAKTLYQALGVASDASPEVIRNAYVKQSAVLRSSGAQARFDFLKQAYEVLADPASRTRYDRQPYLVDETTIGAEERHWLLTWRGALAVLAVAAIGYSAWSYQQREKMRARLAQERLEAQRQEAEHRHRTEEAIREAARRQAEEQQRDAAAAARAKATRGEVLYRETLNAGREMHRDAVQLQRERNVARSDELERRREDAERQRIEREHRRQLEIERRQVEQLERTSPRRF